MKNNLKLGLIIGVSFIISALILGAFFYQTQKPQNTVKVVGMAAKKYEADTVKWKMVLENNVKTDEIKTGYSELESNTEKLIQKLNSNGIKKESINIKPINVLKDYGKEGLRGYRLRQEFFIISEAIDTVEELALNPIDLLEDDIIIQNSHLEYFYSNIDELKKDMVADAAVNAQQRAEKMLENTDLRLGKMLSIKAGVFQITEPYSTQVSSGGIYNTSNRKKEIKVTAHATFEIK